MGEPTFESERIKELKNERISLQKKTFTKWINTFLQDNAKVNDLFEDLTDGRVLICLLESISGEKVGRIARGKQRIHKLENVSKALMFLQKSIKLESIGPEDIVDGKQDLILGLIWMIILRFQISKVENEGGSKDARSAKDALLLWCQRRTKGYPGVDIRNFTTSWKNGLAFNALIHKHRPDLLDFSKLQPSQHRNNLNLAFTVAEEQLGVTKLLDPEDFDCPRPDEKSVMTYVSMLYQYFAKMKSEETGGKRVAKILDVMMDIDKMKQKYQDLVRTLLEWITVKIKWLDDDVPRQSALLQKSMNEFKALRTAEKPKKYIERANIEELFFIIQTKSNAYRLKPYRPPEGVALSDINVAWQELEKGEHLREIRLRKELARQERLSQLAERFKKKAALRDSWLDEMLNVVTTEETSKSLQARDANVSLKRHEAIETDVKARGIKVESVKAICEELGVEEYEGYQEIFVRQKRIEEKWQLLLDRMEKRKLFLVTLSEVNPIISDIEKVSSHLKEVEINLSNEETKRDLGGIDDQIQKHVLQESQLTSYKSQIQSIIASSNDLRKKRHPQSQLIHDKVQDVTKLLENVATQSNTKRKALQESRSFHLFKEAVKKESLFIQDKSQLAASREVGKDFVSFIRLQKKLQALVAEIDACKSRCDVVYKKGQQLISEGNASEEEIGQLIADLQSSVENLQRLAETRAERLNEAAQSFQYYSDANEVESWIDEHMKLVASEDYGKDTETTKSLIQRHQQLTEEITAFNDDMLTLQEECRKIEENDNQIEAKPKEVSSPRGFDEVEVETETEDEETRDKIVEQKVMKEFKVAQVIATRSYSGEGLAMKKGEMFYVAAKTNKDWWNVRRLASKESGYVPTPYIKEIEPKVFKKPVTEKVVVKETVKVKRKKLRRVRIEKSTKEKLPDKRAKRTSSILRKKNNQHGRKPRFTQHFDRENVTTRHLAIVVAYAKLKAATTERGQKLDDALAYFEFCSAHDVIMAWIDDQIRYLSRWTAFNDKVDIDTIKKLLERIEHEISANEKSYEEVQLKGDIILASDSISYDENVCERLKSMQERYKELLNLKASRQSDLIKGHGIDMFLKSCTELISWISAKSSQLAESRIDTNQEKIRALQRRHQNFEHELEAIGGKIKELQDDSKKLRHIHPSARTDVDRKEKEVAQCWTALQEKAASRKLLLQDAYGLQEFLADYRDIVNWAKDARNRFLQSDLPRDFAVVEDVIREHNEAWLETKGNVQRLADIIKSGERLNEKSSTPESIDGLISELKMYQVKVPESWENRRKQLCQCKDALIFCRDADSFVSKAAVIQKLLSTNDLGASLENVTSLLKQVEGLSQKVFQQEERSKKLVIAADETLKANPNETALIKAKRNDVINSHDKTKKLLKQRESALKQSREFHQFQADIEEFISWINDKLALVNDDSYKDLSSLQSKVLKHQALQAEVIANQVTKSRLLQAGDELLSDRNLASNQIENLMASLNQQWEQLENDVKLKLSKLEQATQAKTFSSAFDDFALWCDQIQTVLSSQELGDDLASVKFLNAKHQASENEIAQHQEDLNFLEQEADRMQKDGNFRTETILQNLDQIQQRMCDVSNAAKARGLALNDSYLLQQFLFEVNVQLSWMDEHLTQITNADTGTNLTTAKRLLNRHEAIQNEINSHAVIINKLIENGLEMVRKRPLQTNAARAACGNLKNRFHFLQQASDARKETLQLSCDAFQYILDANEMENWLDEKAVLVVSLQQSKDLDSTERQLKKSIVLMDDLKHSKQNTLLLRQRAGAMQNESNPRKDEIAFKCQSVIDKEQKLTTQLHKIHENLGYLRKVYQFFYDAENIRDFVSDKLKIASSEGYGKDLEHWQAISQKFDDFKVSIAAGKTAYIAVMQLAAEIIACSGPHTNNVSNAKNKLSAMWNRLMDKVKQKNSRLLKAGELHRFNLQVNDIVANLKEKQSKISVNDLGGDVITTESKVREHDAAMNELEAVNRQIRSSEETAKKLMANYPGKTAEQIQMHQSYVKKFYADILRKAKDIKGKLHGSVDYHRLNTEIANLLSWCQETADSVGSEEVLEDVNEIEEAMDKIDDLKLEIDGKEDKFGLIVEAGEQMVEEGHHATEEIQEKLEELITCREDLHNTWLQRKQYLTESYDFAMFCRETSRISLSMTSNKAVLTSVAGDSLGTDIESMSKRVHKVKNMFESQASKLDAALQLGNQLINDQHFASKKVAELIEEVTQTRNSLKTEICERETFLQSALTLADFKMKKEEIQSWITEKLSNIQSRQIDLSNIGIYSTIHKSDVVEFKARNSAKDSLIRFGKKLIESNHYASGEIEDAILETSRLFEQLAKEVKKTGESVEMMKKIAELKRDCNFAEVHITEKERSLATDDNGDDYDKCQILRKHLENTMNHMKADEERITSIIKKAKFLSGINSEFSDEILMHLRMLGSRWENLKELASSRRKILDSAVKLHRFRKNTDETTLRIKEKISLLSGACVADDLAGVQKQLRKHALLESDVEAIEKSLEELDSDAREVVKSSPEDLAEVQALQTDVIEKWETLVELVDERQLNLQAAEHLYRFETDVSSLTSWMQKAREKLGKITESRNVKETKAMLDMYNQIKSELKIREEVYDRVQKYGEDLFTQGGLQPEEVYPKLQKLDKEKEELEALLKEKDFNLKHSFDIQRFGSELEQIRIWLDRRSDMLSNENYGNSLEEVEKLLVQHANMKTTIDKFHENIGSLSNFAHQIGNNTSDNSVRMSKKYEDIKVRLNSADSNVRSKLKKLHESQLFFNFLLQANLMMSWTNEKLKYATSEPETAATLQNSKKDHDAIEAEISANSTNLKDVVTSAQSLVEQSIRVDSVNYHKQSLLESWDVLQAAMKRKGEQLRERIIVDKVNNTLVELTKWLDKTEHLVNNDNDNMGKDLDSVIFLQTKQREIANEIIDKEKVLTDVEGTINDRIEIFKPDMEEMKGGFDDICDRFKGLALMSERRRAALQDSSEFHSLSQEIEDEKLWIKEKCVYLESQEFGSDLASAKHVFKRHQILESEISSHEGIILSLLTKLSEVSIDSIFKEEVNCARERLDEDWQSLKKLAQEKNKKTREFVYFLKLTADINQAMIWLKDHLPVFQNTDYGKDESTASTMLRKTAALQNEVTAFGKTIKELDSRVQNMVDKNFCGETQRDVARNLQKAINIEFENVVNLGNLRGRRLNESIQEHRLNRVTKSIISWVEEKSRFIHNDENGQSLKETEDILKTVQKLMAEMKPIETSVEESREMVKELERSEHSNIKNIKAVFADVENQFSAVRKTSLLRVKDLSSAKQVHLFKQTLNELQEWVKRKLNGIISLDLRNGLQSLSDLRKKHDAFVLDLNALNSQVCTMHESFDALCEQIPNIIGNLQPLVDRIDISMKDLLRNSSETTTDLDKAEDFKSFRQAAEDLRSWIKDRIAIVKGNVESLLSKSVDHENAFITYRNHLTERDAVQSRIDNLFQDSKRLADSMPIVSSIIDDEMKSLSHDWKSFNNELKSFHEDLDDTKDSEALKDDLVNIEEWIDANEATFDDFDGSSLDEIEEMLRMQDDFEKSIAVQEGRFQSTLGRLSKYTEKVENKYTKRMSLGDASMSIESLNADGVEDGNKGLSLPGKSAILQRKIEELHPTNGNEKKETDGRIKPSPESKTQRIIEDINFPDRSGKQANSHGNQPENVMRLKSPRNLHGEKVHEFGSKDASFPGRLESHDNSLGGQPENIKGLEKPKNFRGGRVRDKPGRDTNGHSFIQTAVPDNKETESGTLQREENVDSSKKNDSTEPKYPLDFKLMPVDEKNNEEDFKKDSFADKFFARENALIDDNAAARVALVDNNITVVDDLYGVCDSKNEDVSFLAELSPDANGSSSNCVPSVYSEDASQSFVASEPDDTESISHNTMVDPLASEARINFTDTCIVPDQVATTESSIDFAFLDNDFDDEEEIPVRVEEPLERDVDFFKPHLMEKENLEIPKELEDIFWDETIDNEEADSEDQRIFNAALSSSATKGISSQGVGDVIDQNDSVSQFLPDRLAREEDLVGPRAKEPEHLDKEPADPINPGSSKDSNKTTASNFSLSGKGGSVELRSHMPKILVSHPSGTEDDIKQLLSLETSNDGTTTFAGDLELKEEAVYKGKRVISRKWKDLYAVIIGNSLICYDAEESFRMNAAPRKELELGDAMISVEPGMSGDTLRLVIGDKSEYVVRSNDADRFNRFLMAVSKCAHVNSKEDTISLPPAPPPPTMPLNADGSTGQAQHVKFPETNSRSFQTPESERNLPEFYPPEIVSDESDEFDDILPPPAPVLSLRGFSSAAERRVSLGLLELVGRSSALADNSSDEEDESRSSSTFDADTLEAKLNPQNDEKPPVKVGNMNRLFSIPEPTFADETTPITPFGDNTDQPRVADEVSTGDLSGFLGPATRRRQATDTKPKSIQPDFQLPLNPNPLSFSSGATKDSFDKSPSLPGKEHKKKGFLGGIFKKKK